MFYIDLYLYLHGNNAHKLFKVKAAGSQIPQSDLRREREVVKEKYLQLDLLCVSASISVFTVLCENANVKIKSKMHKIYGVSLADA